MKKINKLLLIPSSVALLLLIADAEAKYCLVAVIVGLMLGTALLFISGRTHQSAMMLDSYISSALGILICIGLSDVFYKTWINHPYRMKDMISLIFSDYPSALRGLSILVSVTALPTVVAVLSLIVPASRKAIEIELKRGFSKQVLLKRFSIVMCCIVLAAILGYVMLIVVYLLPVDRIDENVGQSAYTMQEEGAYPTLSNWFTSDLDNYTDSIMLLESSEKLDISASVDALNSPHGVIENMNYVQILVSHYLNNTPFDRVSYYARYWHGYLVWLKPMLFFIDYKSIRMVNGIIQVILVIVVCVLLGKSDLKKGIIPFVLAYLMLMPVALAKSFQFSSCFYVFMISSIWLLMMDKEKRRKQAYLVFLFAGILTAYFDFLTYPIATFGIVSLIYLLLFEKDTLEKKIADMIVNGWCWILGYGGMWASKWVLASILTDNNIIKNAITAIKVRTSTVSTEGGAYFGILSCEIQNYRAFLKTPVTILAILYCALFIYKIAKKRRCSYEENITIIMTYLIISILPMVWYALTLNHSTIHAWFTNKACVTSFLAVLLVLGSLAEENDSSEKISS